MEDVTIINMKVDRSVPVEHSDKADYTVRARNSKK